MTKVEIIQFNFLYENTHKHMSPGLEINVYFGNEKIIRCRKSEIFRLKQELTKNISFETGINEVDVSNCKITAVDSTFE